MNVVTASLHSICVTKVCSTFQERNTFFESQYDSQCPDIAEVRRLVPTGPNLQASKAMVTSYQIRNDHEPLDHNVNLHH